MLNNISLLGIHPCTVLISNICMTSHLLFFKVAVSDLDPESMNCNHGYHFLEVLRTFLFARCENLNIVGVHLGKRKTCHDTVHHSLKC